MFYLSSRSSLLHRNANAASLFLSLPCPAITGREQHVPGVSDRKQLRVLHDVAHGGTGTRWHQNEGGHASRLRAHPQLQLLCKFSLYDSSWLLTNSMPPWLHFNQCTASEGYVSESNWKSKLPPTELSQKKLPNHCKHIAFVNGYSTKKGVQSSFAGKSGKWRQSCFIAGE